MKILQFVALCHFLSPLGLTAQEVKNQTEELVHIKEGTYTAYLTKKEGSKYTGGIQDLWFEFLRTEDYKAALGSKQKEAYMFIGESKTNEKERTKATLIPDKLAFPMTYVSISYEGNKKLQEEIGYTYQPYEGKPTTRVVFLDGSVYVLEDYIDKDNYTLEYVLEYQEKPMSAFKMIQASMKSPKKMQAMQPQEKLQAYLDAASILQKEAYTNWVQQPNNREWEENLAAQYDLMSKVIRKMSDDWRNSDEYRRIQENNARADRASAASNVTIKNNTGRDIYIFQEGLRNGTRISANSSGSGDCTKSLYYSFSGKSELNGNGLKFYSANASCGGTINVN